MSGLRSTRVRRLAGVAAVLGVLALLSTACTTPSTPNPNQPGGSSFTFRATRAEVVSHNDSFLQGTRDEPFVYNVWFRVKLGVPNSAQVGVAGSRDSASMSLGNGESRYLFSDAEQGAVRFDNVRLVDAGDLLNPQNHLEVVGSWTWAMEEDNISVKGLTDKTAQILKNTLNSTLATMSLPSDTGALVSQIMGSIPQAFLFFAGAAFASIPGLSDDVVGSNIYAGVGATGTLASVLDAATQREQARTIEHFATRVVTHDGGWTAVYHGDTLYEYAGGHGATSAGLSSAPGEVTALDLEAAGPRHRLLMAEQWSYIRQGC